MLKLEDYFVKVNLAEVPPQMEGRQLGFIQNEKGETAFLNLPEASRTVMVFELLANKPRGGHCHKVKEEYIYVIEGNAKVYIWFPEQANQVKCLNLKKADWLVIKPGLAHLYMGEPRALILEQSPFEYNKEHTSIVELPKNIGV